MKTQKNYSRNIFNNLFLNNHCWITSRSNILPFPTILNSVDSTKESFLSASISNRIITLPVLCHQFGKIGIGLLVHGDVFVFILPMNPIQFRHGFFVFFAKQLPDFIGLVRIETEQLQGILFGIPSGICYLTALTHPPSCGICFALRC